jgi:ABC-type spermidine/putrescine transport system permease subunit I
MPLRVAIIMTTGGFFALLLPREGILDGSTRIIPFFALLMAGVLPAMMQTVTVLKGDDLSPRAVNEYGSALQDQLAFWAALFASALSAVGSLTLAVVISKASPLITLPMAYFLDRDFLLDLLIFIFGCTAASVLSRVIAAYGGLKSLLKLNLQLAQRKSKRSAQVTGQSLTKPQKPEPGIHIL